MLKIVWILGLLLFYLHRILLINHLQVSEEEHQTMVERMGSFATTGNNNEYFKVRWTQVLDLVRNKKVYLCDGFAYVIQTDVISGICQTFRSELSQELVVSFYFQFNMILLRKAYYIKNTVVMNNKLDKCSLIFYFFYCIRHFFQLRQHKHSLSICLCYIKSFQLNYI